MALRLAEMGSLVGSGNIDLLAEYGVEDLPVDKEVINPAWRELNDLGAKEG